MSYDSSADLTSAVNVHMSSAVDAKEEEASERRATLRSADPGRPSLWDLTDVSKFIRAQAGLTDAVKDALCIEDPWKEGYPVARTRPTHGQQLLDMTEQR
jgi:hypothetical protein